MSTETKRKRGGQFIEDRAMVRATKVQVRLNAFETERLQRIVEEGGYRSPSEAVRALISK